MKQTSKTRELIVLDGMDVIIRGTYHKTYDESFDARTIPVRRDRIGVLFLNSLSTTRASHGDFAVYLAESFAEHGYPSFRLDLPGFGDSEGDPPTASPGFIDPGGYASIASVKIRELVTRFNLSGVVIVEQYAGGVSALYAAASCPECKGLVLLDPYFLRGTLPPENANLPLLRRWKEVASKGLPILILKAPNRKGHGIKPRVGEFDYIRYVLELAGRGSHVVIRILDGADHSLASRLGRATIRRRTEQWLNACFPLINHDKDVANTLSSQRSRDKSNKSPKASGTKTASLWKVENQHI